MTAATVESPPPMDSNRRQKMKRNDDANESRELPGLRWLAVGAVAGLLAAAYGLLDRAARDAGLPDGSVARINDTLVSRERFDRALDQLVASYGRALSPEDRARVLTQMIEEELLVQRGIELGMATSETTVRSAIVQSLVASITAEADAADPGDDELERFLADNAERYTYAAALTVDAWIADDEWLAQDVVNRLRVDATFTPPDAVRAVPGLPTGPVPLERLRMFLGPAITAAAADMPVGSSAVYARQGRWYIIRVVGREDTAVAELDAVRSQVLIDYRRALADAGLRDYLDRLRRAADVAILAAP